MYPNRNISLDYFRLLLAFFVILIHVGIAGTGVVGSVLANNIFRIAVPCFFIISGYYFADLNNDGKKVFQYVKKLLIIYIVWSIIYAPFTYMLYINGESPKRILTVLSSIFLGYSHLWYIVGMLGACIIIYLVRNINPKLVLIVSVLIYISFIVTKILFYDHPTVSKLNTVLYRNFFTIGFPFMYMGYFIKKYSVHKYFIQRWNLLVLIIGSFILLIAERFILYKYFVSDAYSNDVSLSLIFLCPLLFIYILRVSVYKPNDGYISKLAGGVYFLHMLIMFVIQGIFSIEMTRPMLPVIILFTLLASVSVIELNKRLKVFL